MTRVRLMPHREIQSTAIEWGPWWVRMSGRRAPAEDRLKGWDYETPAAFELQPSFDLDAVAETSGIGDPRLLDVVVMAECTTMGVRYCEARNLAELSMLDSNVIAVEPPLGGMADSVRLSAQLVLNRDRHDSGDGSAFRRGARLASSQVHVVRLEGDSARFPTEEVSFKALGLEAAAWTLQTRFDDLNESFMGGVRLLVNSDHPAADLLLDDDLPGYQFATSALRADVARQLLLHVALDEAQEVSGHEAWSDGSVGAALEGMCSLYLGSDLQSVTQLARSDVLRFERLVQQGFELFKIGRT
jgi:hypothetical protein